MSKLIFSRQIVFFHRVKQELVNTIIVAAEDAFC